MTKQPTDSAELLDKLQRNTFKYIVNGVNLANGLVMDSTKENSPACIAAIGVALHLGGRLSVRLLRRAGIN